MYKGWNGKDRISHRIDSTVVRQDIICWIKYRNGLDGIAIPKKVESAISVIKSMYVKLGVEKQVIQSMRTKWSK